MNNCPCLNVKLQGSYTKAVGAFKNADHGVSVGAAFSELVSAMVNDIIPGDIQLHSHYEPLKEKTTLAEHFAREEIGAFRTGTWPPKNPTPINPELHGCFWPLTDIMKVLNDYPDSFLHYDVDEYPPPPVLEDTQ